MADFFKNIYVYIWFSRSICLKLLERALAFFFLFDRPFAELTQKLDVLDLLWLSLDSCTLKMIPARASALVFVTALYPIAFLDYLAANTLFFFLIFSSSSFGLFFAVALRIALNRLFLLTLILSFTLLCLIDIFFFEVIKHNSL